MNKYIEVNRLEFVITKNCSGNCKHCSNIGYSNNESIESNIAIDVINELAKVYSIDSIMTFGGEPLLYTDTVCKIHETAYKNDIKSRDIITNGFFSVNNKIIEQTARKIYESNVTKILLSVDAFHQEYIPVEPVIYFAKSLKTNGFKGLRTHPAWLVNKDHDNSYNKKTKKILSAFAKLGIQSSEGNNIFPAGNAVKYLQEYFEKPDRDELFVPCGTLPYSGRIDEVKGISINPNGDVMICSIAIGNVCRKNIFEIIDQYDPYGNAYTKMLAEGGVEKLYNYLLDQGEKINIEDCYSSCMLCNKIMETIKKPAGF